jgi:hypothetical protein
VNLVFCWRNRPCKLIGCDEAISRYCVAYNSPAPPRCEHEIKQFAVFGCLSGGIQLILCRRAVVQGKDSIVFVLKSV